MARSAALLAAVLVFSLAAHFQAYRGWFEDDDLDTLTWAARIPLKDLVLNIPSLKYPPEHARPAGYFYYDAISRRAGLDYAAYVAVLQTACVLNIGLLWLLLRGLGLDPLASAAGCLFFALHRALFDAWWKPMFIYDVLCTTFALVSILAYAHRRWVFSFLAFWLAMRSKEVGIVVPAVLLCYEMVLGKRNWRRVIPFFLPAAVYGAYGLRYNLRQHSLYSFHFDGAALWKSLTFYFSRLLWLPYAGFAFLLLPFALRDRRIDFGVAWLLVGLAIYLLLPGRLLEVYLYFAMAGAAVAIAVLFTERPALALPVLLLWTAWQFLSIRHNAASTVEAAGERRAYVAALRRTPDSPVYIYDRTPGSIHSWGVEAGLRLFHRDIQSVHRLEDAGLPIEGAMLLLDWDARTRRLSAGPFFPQFATHISPDQPAAAWQLVRGLQPAANGSREVVRHATARLYRPANATEFEWEACADHAELRTFVAGEELIRVKLEGCQKRRWQLQPGPAGIVGVDFLTVPEREQARILCFGFSAGINSSRLNR